MRAMGIIRRLDELGRVVIPVEMRRMLDLADRDTVEIAVDGDRIVLQKHTPLSLIHILERACRALRDTGVRAVPAVLPAGEETKSLAQYADVYKRQGFPSCPS